ncbi:hypothetical protein [Thermogymnomonas acidicola]|uniref:amino acid kinase family protein n=1 Tax=Thermogymnomonas acidicola TaxID=399579 RepID=UPI001494BAD8|nr:hypothetical protein [Thermogymnomonas acidicola]
MASPRPVDIMETSAIISLIIDGFLPIACGGAGGIPVIRDSTGITPVNGVIDKDATSALLGNLIEAQRLVILTDVEFVYRDYGRPSQEPIRRASAGGELGGNAAPR